LIRPLSAASAGFPISIFWWLLFAGIATYILLRTRPGNWIFGIGGDANAARNVGVPVNRMKIILFMVTAGACLLLPSSNFDRRRKLGGEQASSRLLRRSADAAYRGYGSALGRSSAR
jgi:simple sugar transport system permease protein